ncbi:MAG: twin-arginine translocation signal domain-containing protein [Bacteroidales bacterium]|nr:twin-arginine translocation signal domain-containing protein [Bacteroidales bacterium]
MQRRHFIKGSAILAGAAVTGQAAASSDVYAVV